QGISEVVRGIDLLDSTPRHIYLQQLLNFDTPDYFHIPVAENRLGQKLSKLTGAPGLPLAEPRPQLLAALRSLGQATPTELANSSIADIWRFAISQWNPQVLAGLRSLPCDADTLAAPENGLS
ncbi:MAG: tRNA glutamyl-Q(34) synthetase GluQRS, partial [Woeseia sp.]|nr:tRNA glutamyl-Q(34) synthetase GluQRS [Woeseia sp.]